MSLRQGQAADVALKEHLQVALALGLGQLETLTHSLILLGLVVCFYYDLCYTITAIQYAVVTQIWIVHKLLACEQALLFGRAKRASRERPTSPLVTSSLARAFSLDSLRSPK